MISPDLILGIMMTVVSLLFIVMGLLYLVKRGYWYEKMILTKSDAYIRNIGIAFVIIGSLLLITAIFRIIISL